MPKDIKLVRRRDWLLRRDSSQPPWSRMRLLLRSWSNWVLEVTPEGDRLFSPCLRAETLVGRVLQSLHPLKVNGHVSLFSNGNTKQQAGTISEQFSDKNFTST